MLFGPLPLTADNHVHTTRLKIGSVAVPVGKCPSRQCSDDLLWALIQTALPTPPPLPPNSRGPTHISLLILFSTCRSRSRAYYERACRDRRALLSLPSYVPFPVRACHH